MTDDFAKIQVVKLEFCYLNFDNRVAVFVQSSRFSVLTRRASRSGRTN